MLSIFSTMSGAEIIESIGIVVTIVISVIGLYQSGKANTTAEKANTTAEKANTTAEKANDIARDALKDSQKDYMPVVRFVDKIEYSKKSIKTLRSQTTFDFHEDLVDISWVDNVENDEAVLVAEDYEMPCITLTIENCGAGIIQGITIENLFIQSGNEVSMDIRANSNDEAICCIETECTANFVLIPKEKTIINLVIREGDTDGFITGTSDLYTIMGEFFGKYNNMLVGMSLKIHSINHTKYQQDFLTGVYIDKNIIYNSFTEARCCKKDN